MLSWDEDPEAVEQFYANIRVAEARAALKKKVKLLSIRRTIVKEGSVETMLFSNLDSSDLPCAWISSSIASLPAKCFEKWKSIQLVSFESPSRLIQIESEAFSFSRLRSIEIPQSVEILRSSCFLWCDLLVSVTFESNSRLIQIGRNAFHRSSLVSIEIPRNVQILGTSCFAGCSLLSSVYFQSNSRFDQF
jgi:hypothetical protein